MPTSKEPWRRRAESHLQQCGAMSVSASNASRRPCPSRKRSSGEGSWTAGSSPPGGARARNLCEFAGMQA
eukprot:4239503-Pyramimonas_sp.AAC.1